VCVWCGRKYFIIRCDELEKCVGIFLLLLTMLLLLQGLEMNKQTNKQKIYPHEQQH